MKQSSCGVLVSHVPEFQVLRKVPFLFAFYTLLAASLFAADNTKTTHDSNCSIEVSIPPGHGGDYDKFDTCTESYKNVLYMCKTH